MGMRRVDGEAAGETASERHGGVTGARISCGRPPQHLPRSGLVQRRLCSVLCAESARGRRLLVETRGGSNNLFIKYAVPQTAGDHGDAGAAAGQYGPKGPVSEQSTARPTYGYWPSSQVSRRRNGWLGSAGTPCSKCNDGTKRQLTQNRWHLGPSEWRRHEFRQGPRQSSWHVAGIEIVDPGNAI
jgi:hypothetical protein